MSANETEVQAESASPVGEGPWRTADRSQTVIVPAGAGTVTPTWPSQQPEPQAAGIGAQPPSQPPTAVGGVSGPGDSDDGSQGPTAGTVRTLVPVDDDEDPRPKRRVAILGYTTSLEEAPWGNPEWELWGMNNLHTRMTPEQVAQCTRWYQVHSEAEIQAVGVEHVAWLKEAHPFPIYMIDPVEGITHAPDGTEIRSLAERSGRPAAVVFPRAQLLTHFMRYFTNSVSWEIAHLLFEALYDDEYVLADLALFGIDMAVGSEYADQRPSVEFFLGLAQGLGVNLHIPESSDLLKAAELYGGEDEHSGLRAKCDQRLRELHEQKAHIEAQVAQAQGMHASICGAIDSFSYIKGVWLPPRGSGDARDKVVVPAGSLSPVAQMIAEGEARERHAKTT